MNLPEFRPEAEIGGRRIYYEPETWSVAKISTSARPSAGEVLLAGCMVRNRPVASVCEAALKTCPASHLHWSPNNRGSQLWWRHPHPWRQRISAAEHGKIRERQRLHSPDRAASRRSTRERPSCYARPIGGREFAAARSSRLIFAIARVRPNPIPRRGVGDNSRRGMNNSRPGAVHPRWQWQPPSPHR